MRSIGDMTQPDFLIIPMVVKEHEDLRPSDWIIYSVIYWYEHMKEGQCRASNSSIAKIARIEDRTVRVGLERLEAAGFIKRFFKDPERKQRVEIKCLVRYAVTSAKASPRKGEKLEAVKSKESDKQIVEVIKLFADHVNYACKKFYGNKNQRQAVEELIARQGFERIKEVVEKTLPKTNRIAYLPTITTPIQLRDKWSALESGIYKMKNKAGEKAGSGVTI